MINITTHQLQSTQVPCLVQYENGTQECLVLDIRNYHWLTLPDLEEVGYADRGNNNLRIECVAAFFSGDAERIREWILQCNI